MNCRRQIKAPQKNLYNNNNNISHCATLALATANSQVFFFWQQEHVLQRNKKMEENGEILIGRREYPHYSICPLSTIVIKLDSMQMGFCFIWSL
jgi:hypothetical protein